MDYSNLVTHRWLVRDAIPTDAFAQAIAYTVKEGEVVLDVGAGCGILSLLAA